MVNIVSVFHGFAATKAMSKTARNCVAHRFARPGLRVALREMSQLPAILPWPSYLSAAGCAGQMAAFAADNAADVAPPQPARTPRANLGWHFPSESRPAATPLGLSPQRGKVG